MTFNSYQFICLALPMLYIGFLLAFRAQGWPGAFRFLAVASLAFYSAWSLPTVSTWALTQASLTAIARSLAPLAILSASVVANYAVGNLILRCKDQRRRATLLLFAGLAGNMLALGYLKYANFLIDIVNLTSITNAGHIGMIVPIGMSFYTFIQIGYLIDAYAGQVERPAFWNYVLFATFLPCVTAGPLVQQREIFAQMQDRRDAAFNPLTLAAGLTMFALGLFKKVVFADNLAPFADAVFNGVAAGEAATAATAWLGSICYALQLYFDFSGYSDMALGIGFIFGIRLPLNFDSPFKATNISEFWRRWHMTMTRFFTAYVYTPLAVRGMRRVVATKTGDVERYVRAAAIPAVVTFLVAGIWHGAGWTFVVYGLIHGFAIAAYLGWSRLGMRPMPMLAGWLLTMSVVVSALVVFRAPDLATAGNILASMWSFGALGGAAAGRTLVGIDIKTATSMVVLLGAVVLLFPNTQQILHQYWISSDTPATDVATEAGLVVWRPGFAGSIAIGALLCIAIGCIGAGSTFLYYQF